MKQLVGMIAMITILALRPGVADAQEYCRIDKPQVTKSSATTQLKMTVVCQTAASQAAVRYPKGPLHVGVTLYKITDARLREKSVPVIEERVDHTYIKPIEITRPASSQEIVVPLGDVGDKTHILVAVWDKKNPCGTDDSSDRCTVAGATLGDTDSLELPIPIDAWPRPICNIEEMTRKGFFKWSESDGDINEDRIPDRYASLFHANDCFVRFTDRAGLGYSVRQWRAQPLPK